MTACVPKDIFLVLICVFMASLVAIVALVPVALGRATPIHDITFKDGGVMVETSWPHRLLTCSWVPVRLSLRGTGLWLHGKSLDSKPAPRFRAQVVGVKSLWLLDAHGDYVTEKLEASMGYLQVRPPYALLCMGCCCIIPSAVTIAALVFVAMMIWMHLEVASWYGLAHLVTALSVGLPCQALVYLVFWLRSFEQTSLVEKHQEFRESLRQRNPNPQRCDRGPQRAITAGHLQDLFTQFAAFIRDRNMYYVAANMVKPLTKPDELSYAELVGPEHVEWFVSHYWGTKFKDFLESICKHAENTSDSAPAPARPVRRGTSFCVERNIQSWIGQGVRYWVCTFSNNQWDLGAELGCGKAEDSSFNLALRSPACRGTAMVMDAKAMPLTRSWCLFEVLQTLAIKREGRENFVGLQLCTAAGVLNAGMAGVEVALKVAQKLATLNLEDATATDPNDKAMIDACVIQKHNGFEAVNRFVRESIQKSLELAQECFNNEALALQQELDSIPSRHSVLSVAVSVDTEDKVEASPSSSWSPGDLVGRWKILRSGKGSKPSSSCSKSRPLSE
jgi:hypothetical protein